MENLENVVANAMNITGTEPVETTPTTTDTEPQTVEGQQAEQPAAQAEQPQATQDNSTIKQMREQLAQYKQQQQDTERKLQRIADSMGKSIDEVLADIQAKEDKVKGDRLGVSPEIAAQIRQQEARIKELEEQSIRDDFNNRANNFKKEFNLNEVELNKFFQDAVSKGFDLTRKGTDLGVIYRAINFEKLSAAKEAEIRQQILNEMQQQRESANAVNNVYNQPATSSSADDNDYDFVKTLKQQFNNK